ncbi:MAG: S41 family peptidase [Paludibacteraceae bacterium]|nr:S41 family peptidase [Paludibacteraceae bacterium]
MTRKTCLYIAVLLLGATACTHRFEGVEDNTPVGNMECLWQTLDEKYCFFEEKDVDWQAVHDRYIDDVRQLKSDDYIALFDTLAEMINTLNDGHVNLYSSFDISTCKSWYAGYATNFNWAAVKNYYLPTFRTAGGAYYNTIADGTVGYMYVADFQTAVQPTNMAYILRSFGDCKGLIVDVRNNGGGNLSYAYQLAATFFSEDKVVGYWQHKNGVGHNDFSALKEQTLRKSDMPSSWKRPVVVLCNRHSYSAANFFVSIMRYAPNATIVGDMSGGGGGMPMSYELPNGWMVRFSSIRMFDMDNHSIEPGIMPDVRVDDVPETPNDEIIDAAIDLINRTYHDDTSN